MRKMYTPKEKRAALKAIANGASIKQVAKETGIHLSTLYQWKQPNPRKSVFRRKRRNPLDALIMRLGREKLRELLEGRE